MSRLEVQIRPSGTVLAAPHKEIMAAGGRYKPIDWSGFDVSRYDDYARRAAIAGWNQRMADEYRSTTLFSQLQTLLLLANVPLDVIGAAAKVVADEVRHVQLCADVVTALGGMPASSIDAGQVYLLIDPAQPLLPQLLNATVNMLCLGETVSARLIGATKDNTTCPEIHETLRILHVDEVFHGEFGWQLAGLLLGAADEQARAALETSLPASLAQLEIVCTHYGDIREMSADDFALGSLSHKEHRDAFHAAVEETLLPRFESLGLNARDAWSRRAG